MRTRCLILVVASLVVGGCAAESAEPAFDEAEVDGVEQAVRDALAMAEEQHGLQVGEDAEAEAIAQVREALAWATAEPVGSTSAAIEQDEAFDAFGDEVGGGPPSTNGSFGTGAGAQNGGFGTSAGADDGSFGTSAGSTGGSFSGPQGAQNGSFTAGSGGIYFPCRSYGTVTAFSEESLGTFGIDCVAAGSRPVLRWPTVGGGGPYELVTITIDLNTIFTLSTTGTATESFLAQHVWGPLDVGGTSVAYGGPPLTASGGVGVLIGGVESAGGDFGLFVALVI
ncbi:MAG: hypothetical protein ACODAU_11960 [Myxococcota bacterium]